VRDELMRTMTEERTDTAPIDSIARSLRRRVQLTAGIVVAVAVALQPPADVFLFDAADYWGGSRALLEGGDVAAVGLLELRGALTPLVYLPAALVASVVGQSAAADAVLAQNAILIGFIGAVLIPRLVAIWRPTTPRVVWVSALGAGLTLAGFAPLPLTDLWGVALLLAAVIAVDARWRGALLAGGLAAGVAINLRPAYLVPVAAICAVVLVGQRLRGLWLFVGIGLALAPQAVMNRIWGVTVIPWPERTVELSSMQALYASFVVRYDTYVVDGATSQLFFCDPALAADVHADGDYVRSSGELAGWMLSHLPHSLAFTGQKVAAALHWPLSTPYYAPGAAVNGVFAGLVTAIAVLGAVGLARATIRRGLRKATPAQVAAVVAWAGSLLTLLTSAPETRFALPLVIFGIAGCAVLFADGPHLPRSTRGRVWVAGGLVAVVAVYGLGAWGMAHPVMGAVNGPICADS
jgi:hypothetical protein